LERAGGGCHACGRPHLVPPDRDGRAAVRPRRARIGASGRQQPAANLRSLCQRCQVLHDVPHHTRQRWRHARTASPCVRTAQLRIWLPSRGGVRDPSLRRSQSGAGARRRIWPLLSPVTDAAQLQSSRLSLVPPATSPSTPVDLRGHLLLVGKVPCENIGTISVVCRLIADVLAVAYGRIGIDEGHSAVSDLMDELVRRQRCQCRLPFRCVCRNHRTGPDDTPSMPASSSIRPARPLP
jgi:hypothetical protein